MIVFLILMLVGAVVSAEQPSNPCPSNKCFDGVTCIADQEQGVCECMQGYSGNNCSDTHECKNGQGDPCGHRGVCENIDGSYTCNCLEGWNGTNCFKNTTNDPPCMPGYSGERCHVSECEHGYAVNYSNSFNDSNSFKCYCYSGWTRLDENAACTVDIDECTMNVCQNGGNCTNTNGSYNCACLKPWDGQNCSHHNICLINPCEHEGTCTMIENNANNTYVCSCKDGWQGFNCSDDVDECLPKSAGLCYHGNCTNYPGSYNCSCLDGWSGRNCSDSILSSTNTFTHIPTTDTNIPTTYTNNATDTTYIYHLASVSAQLHISVIIGTTVGALVFVIVGSLVGYLLYKRKRMQISSMEVTVEMPERLEKQDK